MKNSNPKIGSLCEIRATQVAFTDVPFLEFDRNDSNSYKHLINLLRYDRFVLLSVDPLELDYSYITCACLIQYLAPSNQSRLHVVDAGQVLYLTTLPSQVAQHIRVIEI